MEARTGYTYRVIKDGKEVEHFNVVRIHGRRIYFAVTARSCLCWKSTRLKWSKSMEGLKQAGCTITEEPSHD